LQLWFGQNAFSQARKNIKMVQRERFQRCNGPDWQERGTSSATKEKNTWIEKETFYNENTKVKLWKWLKLWSNGIKTFSKTTASWISKDKAFLKLPDPDLLKKRRHTIEGLPTSLRVNKTTESDSKVRKLTTMFSGQSRTISSFCRLLVETNQDWPALLTPSGLKLPDINFVSAHAPESEFKSALMRRAT